MTNLPNLGEKPKKSPLPLVLAIALGAGLLAGGGYLLVQRHKAGLATGGSEPSAEGAPAQADGSTAAPDASVIAAAPLDPAEALKKSGLHHISVKVNGPLESGIVAQAGKDVGQPLTQVVTRALVWWVDVPGDLLKGDQLEVLYEERANDEPVVHAV